MKHVVAVIPAGVGLDAALAALRGLGECYPPDTLSLGTDPAGGMRVVHDPAAGTAVAAPTTRVQVGLGVDDADDLLRYAFGADDQQEAVQALALAFVEMLEQAGAANYLTVAVETPEVGRYAVTVQRCTGITPAERITALEAQLAELHREGGDSDGR